MRSVWTGGDGPAATRGSRRAVSPPTPWVRSAGACRVGPAVTRGSRGAASWSRRRCASRAGNASTPSAVVDQKTATGTSNLMRKFVVPRLFGSSLVYLPRLHLLCPSTIRRRIRRRKSGGGSAGEAKRIEVLGLPRPSNKCLFEESRSTCWPSTGRAGARARLTRGSTERVARGPGSITGTGPTLHPLIPAATRP